jgi:hypothetical protein
MIDTSVNGIVNLVQAMHQAKLSDQVQTEMLKKANELTKQQGEAAVQLMQSVPQAGGNSIDLYA